MNTDPCLTRKGFLALVASQLILVRVGKPLFVVPLTLISWSPGGNVSYVRQLKHVALTIKMGRAGCDVTSDVEIFGDT